MKKLLILLITLLLLCSCTIKKKETEPTVYEKDGSKYLELIKNYKTRTKNKNNTIDNPEFDKYLDSVFVDLMNSDFMTMHFKVVDYKKYNIDKPPVDLLTVNYGFDQENYDYFVKQLEELQAFDFDSLSYRQQYDYEAQEYSLYETLADYCYYQYNFIFSTGSCLPENLVSNFVDYTFYDEESLEDYMTCLEDVDRLFDDALKYTSEQSKDGYPLINAWIDYSRNACLGVLNKTDDNDFIVSFDKRIKELAFLSEDKKNEYIEKNKKIVLEEVLPAYQKVYDDLEQYRNKAKMDNYRLSNINKEYAELQYILSSSCNKSMDTLMQELTDNLAMLEAEYISCVYDESSFEKYNQALMGGYNFSLTGKNCLEYLRENLHTYYPDLGDVDYTVEQLDPDTAPSTTVAYYWPSPVDNLNQNIIRTNPNNMNEGFATYSTLAHEGLPGHLYQHVFYYRTNPHNFRSAIGFSGYTEGWAVNAQYYAMQISGIDDHYAASAVFFEDAYFFILYTIVDIGINYYGWKEKDIIKYFEDESRVFSFDNNTAKEMIDLFIEMPAVYTPYGAGYSNFMTLENKAKAALGGKFDYVKYHESLLKNGPLPFNILETAVDEYIAENR